MWTIYANIAQVFECSSDNVAMIHTGHNCGTSPTGEKIKKVLDELDVVVDEFTDSVTRILDAAHE
jgi:hypothetical protein